MLCKKKKAIVKGVYEWILKEKKHKFKKDKSTSIKKRKSTMDKSKALMISHTTKLKKVGTNKKGKGSNKIGHYPLLLNKTSSKIHQRIKD